MLKDIPDENFEPFAAVPYHTPFLLDKLCKKRSIKDAWDWHCAYCGIHTKELSIDHIVPRSKGGSEKLFNLIPACHSCNQSKAHEECFDWYATQIFFDIDRWRAIREWIFEMSFEDT